MIYILVDQLSVELALMNENFVNAKELFDRMMEESLAKHNPNGQCSF
jgi:signal transducing adaptor molecule